MRLNRPENTKPSRGLTKSGIIKLIAMIICGFIAIIGSMFYRNWSMHPGSSKEFTPSNQYKKDVVQGEKDKKDFDEIIKKLEAKKLQEDKEFKSRGVNGMNGNVQNTKPLKNGQTTQTSQVEAEPKVGKVKLSTKAPVYETGPNVMQPQSITTEQTSDTSITPIPPQPQAPKKQQKMVRYNDWVDEVPEVKDPMSQTQDKVIQDEGLLRKDTPTNNQEDSQRQF